MSVITSRVIHFARKLRKTQTKAEQRLWSRLRRRQVDGFRVLRFWNGDVMAQTDAVLDTIFEALHSKTMEGRFD